MCAYIHVEISLKLYRQIFARKPDCGVLHIFLIQIFMLLSVGRKYDKKEKVWEERVKTQTKQLHI